MPFNFGDLQHVVVQEWGYLSGEFESEVVVENGNPFIHAYFWSDAAASVNDILYFWNIVRLNEPPEYPYSVWATTVIIPDGIQWIQDLIDYGYQRLSPLESPPLPGYTYSNDFQWQYVDARPPEGLNSIAYRGQFQYFDDTLQEFIDYQWSPDVQLYGEIYNIGMRPRMILKSKHWKRQVFPISGSLPFLPGFLPPISGVIPGTPVISLMSQMQSQMSLSRRRRNIRRGKKYG